MFAFRLSSTATAFTTTMSAGSLHSTKDIEPNQLADLIKKGVDLAFGRLIIVDCRRFLDYNTSHIKNAVNVCCSKLIRKRLLENKMSILDVLRPSFMDLGGEFSVDPGESDRKPLDVVLYADQYGMTPVKDTRAAERSGAKKCSATDEVSFLTMLMEKLNQSSQFQSVRLLKGGFVDFQARYPDLCEGASSMGSTTSGRGSNGSGGLGVASKLTLSSLSQPCLPVSNQGPTKILPFLYLGSQQDAMDQDTLSKYGIDYILNMSVGCPKPDFVQDEHFMRIAVNDSNSEKLLPYFERAFEFLDKVKEANSCVLVHCLAGISRSPTLAIAFVMRHLHMSSEEAYRYVKEKRPAISPNFNFLGQLLEFEKQLKASRQIELQQQHANYGFNSITPSLKPGAPQSSCLHDTGSKTAATTPESYEVSMNTNQTKASLFLNLQNSNRPAKIPVTQCSSNRDVTTTSPIDTTTIKRSSSCPVKIQKNCIGNNSNCGPFRDALNLELEFSPATRTNANGKRQMMPSLSPIPNQIITNEINETKIDDEKEKVEKTEFTNLTDEALKLRNIFKEFDTEKFLSSDFFTTTTRSISPKINFNAMKILKPVHQELPSPSTELSKLNFDNNSIEMSEKFDTNQSTIPKWCPNQVQIQNDYKLSFPKLPLISPEIDFQSIESTNTNRYDRRSISSHSTCATNPFFSSSTSSSTSIGCDFRNVKSQQFGMNCSNLRLFSNEFDEKRDQSMTIVEETMDEFETSTSLNIVKSYEKKSESMNLNLKSKSHCNVESFDHDLVSSSESNDRRSISSIGSGSIQGSCSVSSVSGSISSACGSMYGSISTTGSVTSSGYGSTNGSISAENPLFRSSCRSSSKQRRSSINRYDSLMEEDQEKIECPMTAPVLLPEALISSAVSQSHQIRPVRSESQLSCVSTLQQVTMSSMREKLASARSMLVSSFSQRMRQLLTKRASWPHAVPYLAAIPNSESEASALWAFAPSSLDRVDDGARRRSMVEENKTPSKSKSETTVLYELCNQHVPSIVQEEACGTSASDRMRVNGIIDSSLLAPPFDIDSPESGFVESPTTVHQRETASSSASTHVSASNASSMFLHRDPERDSLGSTSSLEIAVS